MLIWDQGFYHSWNNPLFIIVITISIPILHDLYLIILHSIASLISSMIWFFYLMNHQIISMYKISIIIRDNISQVLAHFSCIFHVNEFFNEDTPHFRGDSLNEMCFLLKTNKYLNELNIFTQYLNYIVSSNVLSYSISSKSSTLQCEIISCITSIEGR